MKQFNFKISDSDAEKFEYVCKTYGLSKARFFVSCINNEYDKLHDNEQVKDLVEQMKALSNKFAELTGQQFLG